jgi:hypothetical protein
LVHLWRTSCHPRPSSLFWVSSVHRWRDYHQNFHRKTHHQKETSYYQIIIVWHITIFKW